jgi:hypothetical protein
MHNISLSLRCTFSFLFDWWLVLQEIMDEPYIAADGFTYEYRAIKAWLSKHNVSPVTKHKLQHSELIPNHTLRSAIQEWKSEMTLLD